MKIVFRTDASVGIGSGHVMRCLTLAEELRARGADIAFISRELPGHMCDLIEMKGYSTVRLPGIDGTDWQQDADETAKAITSLGGPVSWLIADHYGIDRTWEQRLRPTANRIMVIDDLVDRPHDCDLLLDQNLHIRMEGRYDGLAPPGCTLLLGPGYALLRREFAEVRRTLRARDGSVKRILVFLGGSDSTNETEKTLVGLRQVDLPDIAVDVVIGATNPNKECIKTACGEVSRTTCYEQVSNMAELMGRVDLAIGAGGTTTWERCFLGLPSISLVVADNQQEITEAVAAAGATVNLGWAGRTTARQIADAIITMLQDQDACREMSKKAFAIMNGWTGTELVAGMIMGETDA